MSLLNNKLPNKGRILALDLGTKRTGVAISDASQQVAFPRDEIEHGSIDELIVQLQGIIEGDGIVGILTGLPINMSGKVTRQTEITMEIIEQLQEAFDLPIELVDERLTSQFARASSPKGAHVDSRAAQIMLEMSLS